MRRGIHHSTALTLHHQSPTILSEGMRISRKCSRLDNYLKTFSSFTIDFIMQHHSLHHALTLRHRFLRAIARAATDHFRVWRLTVFLLWPRFIDYVHRRIRSEHCHPSMIDLVEKTFKKDRWCHLPTTDFMSDAENGTRKKKRKLNPPGDQIHQSPSGPVIAQSISGNSTTTDDDSTPNESNEDSKMFEVPSDDSITAQ